MLARRVVTRPATLRSQLRRRFIPSSTSTTSGSQLQAPRPNTWLAKIRFREDGKPRSKDSLIALGFGSLILLSVFSSLTLNIAKEDDDDKIFGLLRTIFVQQVDIAYYDSVNFDDPKSTQSYFIKLCLSIISKQVQEEAEQRLNDLMTRIAVANKTKKNSGIETEAQNIIRRAAETIHGAFQELKRDSIVTTSEFVLDVLLVALKDLTILSFDVDVDDSPDFTSSIRDHT